MIRLTVMYNLPPGTDEAEFLAWRLGEHQQSNATQTGVIRTDFARIDRAWPPEATPTHRFMTIAEYETWEAFEANFYSEAMQASLRQNMDRIADAVFLVSEVLTSTEEG
ncbi:MAG: hypothetical protein AAF787_13440 [Chloroflexota bacterium]